MLLDSAPVLHCPDFKAPYCIQTDASNSGLGSVLIQCVDGEERLLEFASRVLTSAERNYSVSERVLMWKPKNLQSSLTTVAQPGSATCAIQMADWQEGHWSCKVMTAQ